MPVSGRAALAVVLLVGASACTRIHARTPVPLAALEMPLPPARLLVPVPLEEPEDTAVALPDPPATSPPAARPREGMAAVRSAPERPLPVAPAATPPEPTPAPAPPVLQTGNVSALEQHANALLGVAQRGLARLKPDSLSANARAQYDQAIGFVRMASELIKIKNYMLAEQLASKADAVATQLAKE
ncbi:MAG: hypothetical protein ABI051_15015 [Vicinamibacterales bacterium]